MWASEIVGKHVLFCHPEKSREKVQRALAFLRTREGTAFRRMVVGHRRDRRWESTYVALRDESGNHLGAVVVTTDITERVKAEEKRLAVLPPKRGSGFRPLGSEVCTGRSWPKPSPTAFSLPAPGGHALIRHNVSPVLVGEQPGWRTWGRGLHVLVGAFAHLWVAGQGTQAGPDGGIARQLPGSGTQRADSVENNGAFCVPVDP